MHHVHRRRPVALLLLRTRHAHMHAHTVADNAAVCQHTTDRRCTDTLSADTSQHCTTAGCDRDSYVWRSSVRGAIQYRASTALLSPFRGALSSLARSPRSPAKSARTGEHGRRAILRPGSVRVQAPVVTCLKSATEEPGSRAESPPCMCVWCVCMYVCVRCPSRRESRGHARYVYARCAGGRDDGGQ